MSVHPLNMSRVGERRYLLPLGMAMTTLVSVAGCDVRQDARLPVSGDSSPSVLHVNVIRANADDDAVSTSICYGKLTPRRGRRIRFAIRGRVETVSRRPGDSVGEGDKLAALDQVDLQKQKLTVEQSLRNARAELLTSSPQQEASLAKQIQQLESQLAELTTELAKGVLVAPFAGKIASVDVAEGMPVSPGMPAFDIVEEAPPFARARLTEGTSAKLTQDQGFQVHVGSDSVGAKLQSRARFQGPIGGETLLLEFTEELTEDSWSYGDVVEIRFDLPSGEAGFWLPLTSIQHQVDGGWSLLVAAESTPDANDSLRVVRRDVEVKLLQDGRALVQGALEAGERVIVDGTHRVVPGQRVRVMKSVDGAARPPGVAE